MRVTAQLIDAIAGNHVWADRYDRELTDIFEVQDEVTDSTVASLAPEFETAEMRRSSRAARQELSVWDLVIKARWHLGQYQKPASDEAIKLVREAIRLDSRDQPAHSVLAMALYQRTIYGWSEDFDAARGEALKAGQRAVALDSGDATAHTAHGAGLVLAGAHAESIAALRQATELNPNLAMAHGWLGLAYLFASEIEPAMAAAKRAISLSPRDLDKPFWMAALSFGCYVTDRLEEALAWTETMLREKPDLPTALRHRAVTLVRLGRPDEARALIDRLRSLTPNATVSHLKRAFTVKDPAMERRWLDDLRRAGLPD